MKCKTLIDPSREEEVIIYAHERTPLVEEIEALVSEEAAELIGYSEGSIVPIRATDFDCFTVEEGRVFALRQGERLQLRIRLYQLEERLDRSFIKINQSCIANIKKITRFEVSIGGSLLVCFAGGHKDYVSRRQLKAVKERLGFRL